MVPVTYPQKCVGFSLSLDEHRSLLASEGWHCFRIRRRIGTGQKAFKQARTALMRWEMQRHAGLRPLIDAHTVTLHVGPVRQRCWIVHSESSATKACVAYGTMAGHLESGEESFSVWLDGEKVWAECAAFSKPNSWVTRLAGPLARAAQRLMARRYLSALVAANGGLHQI